MVKKKPKSFLESLGTKDLTKSIINLRGKETKKDMCTIIMNNLHKLGTISILEVLKVHDITIDELMILAVESVANENVVYNKALLYAVMFMKKQGFNDKEIGESLGMTTQRAKKLFGFIPVSDDILAMERTLLKQMIKQGMEGNASAGKTALTHMYNLKTLAFQYKVKLKEKEDNEIIIHIGRDTKGLLK